VVILVEKSRRPRRWAGVALFAALLMAALWIEQRGDAPRRSAEADATAPGGSLAPTGAVLPATGLSFSSEPMVAHAPAAVVPEGMTAAQWLVLQESLKDHPQREAEIARISEYMAFQSRLDRYRSLRAQTDSAAQASARELAGGLLDGLPTHAARGELSAAEALLVQGALIDTLLPDDAARALRRDQERKRLADALPAAPDEQATAERNARFLREQAALVAAWQAQPPARRDPHALEASIAALRQSIFDRQRNGGQP